MHVHSGALPILRDAALRAAPQDEVVQWNGNTLILRSERSERLEGWATVEIEVVHHAPF
jgi:hypothetical protein